MRHFALVVVNVNRKAARERAIEQHPKKISLKVPAVYASPKIVSYLPDGFM
jgi:hypothetical protein